MPRDVDHEAHEHEQHHRQREQREGDGVELQGDTRAGSKAARSSRVGAWVSGVLERGYGGGARGESERGEVGREALVRVGVGFGARVEVGVRGSEFGVRGKAPAHVCGCTLHHHLSRDISIIIYLAAISPHLSADGGAASPQRQ